MGEDKTQRAGWWASENAEFYTVGPCDTREQAIAEGAEDFEGGSFYIVEAGVHVLRFRADLLIEDQYFEKDGLFADEGGRADRRGDSKAADEELQQLLDGWLAKHAATFVRPNAFAWSRNEEFIPAGAVSGEMAA